MLAFDSQLAINESAICMSIGLGLVDTFSLQPDTPSAGGVLFIAFHLFLTTCEASASYSASIMRIQVDG